MPCVAHRDDCNKVWWGSSITGAENCELWTEDDGQIKLKKKRKFRIGMQVRVHV